MTILIAGTLSYNSLVSFGFNSAAIRVRVCSLKSLTYSQSKMATGGTTIGFKKGDIVLSSKPFVYILNHEFRGNHCNGCLKRKVMGMTTLSCCSQCKFFYYCSKACQRSDWSLHKHECKKIKRLPDVTVINDALLIARLLIKLQECDGEEESETVGPYTRKFGDLISHAEELQNDKSKMKKVFDRYDVLQKYLGEKNVPPFFTVLEIMGKVLVNAISIEDSDTLTVIGNGLFLGASILDHSCDADAEFSFRGTTVYVHAIKDLPHHDIKQVHISYADRMEPAEIRQKMLYEKYYFKCTCTRCHNSSSEAFLSEVLDKRRGPTVERESRELLTCLEMMQICGENPLGILQLALLGLEHQVGVLGERHVLRVKLKVKAMDLHTILGQWKEAADLGVQVLGPIRRSYGPYSHQIATRLMSTAVAQLHAGNKKEAKKNVRQAKDVMAVAFGTEHKTYKEAEQIQSLISFMESGK